MNGEKKTLVITASRETFKTFLGFIERSERHKYVMVSRIDDLRGLKIGEAIKLRDYFLAEPNIGLIIDELKHKQSQ